MQEIHRSRRVLLEMQHDIEVHCTDLHFYELILLNRLQIGFNIILQVSVWCETHVPNNSNIA